MVEKSEERFTDTSWQLHDRKYLTQSSEERVDVFVLYSILNNLLKQIFSLMSQDI